MKINLTEKEIVDLVKFLGRQTIYSMKADEIPSITKIHSKLSKISRRQNEK